MAKKDYTKSYSPGFLPYTSDMMKHAKWCLKNKIAVALRYAKPYNFFVDVKINGIWHKDPKENYYNGLEAQEKMYEYYKKYYDKYNNNKNEK
jgi:hypothetical protein